jgi:MFS family permease
MPFLVAFKHRVFTLLWIGQTISRLGDRIYSIALAWWVLEKTHSAITMSVVLIASSLPSLVFMLIGGVVADRVPRLAIMLVSDLTRGVLVAVITIMAFTNTLPLWPIIGVSFCFGLMDAFFLPAYSAVIPQILPKPDLASANSLRILSGRAMSLGGPAIGAALIAIGGTPIAFAINSASFFVSAACLLAALPLLPKLPRELAISSSGAPLQALLRHFRQDFAEGMATVKSITWVWLTIVIAGVANFIAGGATSVALRFYVQNTLQSPFLYGGITAATAGGSILGTLWFGSRSIRRRGWVIYGLFMLNVLVISLIGFFPNPVVILAAMFVYGGCATSLGLAWVTALQEYIPNEQMGRVSSVDQLGSSIGDPLSLGLAGIVTDRFGALPVLIWSGILSAMAVGIGFFSRSVRALD